MMTGMSNRKICALALTISSLGAVASACASLDTGSVSYKAGYNAGSLEISNVAHLSASVDETCNTVWQYVVNDYNKAEWLAGCVAGLSGAIRATRR